MTSIDNLNSLSISLFFSHRNLGHNLLNSRPTIHKDTNIKTPTTPLCQNKKKKTLLLISYINQTLLIISPVLLVLPLIFKGFFFFFFFCNLTNPSFKEDKQLAPIPDPDPTLSESDPSARLNLSLLCFCCFGERESAAFRQQVVLRRNTNWTTL